ncbi:MAG: hypothetical protein EA365_14435 [Gloeocapsa sp. DLM2.Bin57]|nr:MAG: hypothetical protein EA365_14435 [Gloeocapsa sp. DLM2.Bin57]
MINEDNLSGTSFPLQSEDELARLMQIKETKAKKLIANRECTQCTYLYTLKGQKVRRTALIIE